MKLAAFSLAGEINYEELKPEFAKIIQENYELPTQPDFKTPLANLTHVSEKANRTLELIAQKIEDIQQQNKSQRNSVRKIRAIKSQTKAIVDKFYTAAGRDRKVFLATFKETLTDGFDVDPRAEIDHEKQEKLERKYLTQIDQQMNQARFLLGLPLSQYQSPTLKELQTDSCLKKD